VLGGVGSRECARGAVEGLHREDRHPHEVRVRPWTSYADRFLNELNSKSKLCDLIIGDSQWIGGAAENGHYVKLNEFFDKNGIR
jgi:hypothetical protein